MEPIVFTCSRNRIRRLIINGNLIPYRCVECDNDGEWRGKKLTLQLDHINGDRNDNRLDNFRFLCPNCHTQTPTYSIGIVKILDTSKEGIEHIVEMGKNRMTVSAILRHLGVRASECNRSEVRAILTEAGVALIDLKRAVEDRTLRVGYTPPIAREELEKLIDKMPLKQIARTFSVGPNAIRRWCRKYDLKPKPTGYWQHRDRASASNWPTVDELRKLVWEKPMSDIATQIGVSAPAVRMRCIKYGIDRPPFGHWQGRKGTLSE